MKIETVAIKGPGGIARIPKNQLEDYLKKDGYELAPESEQNSAVQNNETTQTVTDQTTLVDVVDVEAQDEDSEEVTAADIKKMTADELEDFVEDHELKTNLSDHRNLKAKKHAVINELGLEG